METSTESGGKLKLDSVWLLPLLAFTGFALLVAFGGENWLYRVTASHKTTQVLEVKTDTLQGMVEFPKVAQLGAHLYVNGWVGSLVPAIHPQEIILYLDNKPVAETGALLPVNSNGNVIHSWELDFFVENTQPGEHTLAVQAVPEGHSPVAVAQTTLLISR